MNINIVAAGDVKCNASIQRSVAFAKELILLGDHPTLFLRDCIENRKFTESRGVSASVKWIESRYPFSYIWASLGTRKPDLVHITNANLAGIAVGLVEKFRGGLVLSDWDEWLSKVHAPWTTRCIRKVLELAACRFSDVFVYASRHLADTHDSRCTGCHLVYIPYGYDPERHPDEVIDYTQFEINSGIKYITYVGSFFDFFSEDLNQLVLLAEACKRFGYGVMAIGDGSERKRIEENLKSILGTENVAMLGMQTPHTVDGLLSLRNIVATFLPLKDTVQNRSRCPNKMFHYIKGGKAIITNRVGEALNLLGDSAAYYEYSNLESLTGAISGLDRWKGYPSDSSHTWRIRVCRYRSFLFEQYPRLRSVDC